MTQQIQYAKKLSAYNAEGTKITDSVPYIEVQWNRKFYEAGNFSVYLRLEDYNSSWLFVCLDGRTEWGMIQKFEYKDTDEGEFITLSGFFMEGVLKWMTLLRSESWQYPSSFSSLYGTMAGLFSAAVSEGKDTVNSSTGFNMFPFEAVNYTSSQFTGIPVSFERGKTIHDIAYGSLISQESQYSLRITPTFWGGGGWQEITIARLTGSNSGITFSKANGNIKKINFSRDESGMRNGVRGYSIETAGLAEKTADVSQSQLYETFYPRNTNLYTDEQLKELQTQAWLYPWGVPGTVNPSIWGKMWLPENMADANWDSPFTPVNDYKLYSSQIVETRQKLDSQTPRCFPGRLANGSINRQKYAAPLIEIQSTHEKNQANRETIVSEYARIANNEFRNHTADISLSGEIVSIDGSVYNTDYTLGSTVTVVVQGVSELQAYSCRITECNEVHHKNTMDVTVNFAYPRLQKSWKPPLL